jgi:hypothetical protein
MFKSTTAQQRLHAIATSGVINVCFVLVLLVVKSNVFAYFWQHRVATKRYVPF